MITIGKKYIKIDTPATSLIFCIYDELLEIVYYGKKLGYMSDYDIFTSHKRKYCHSSSDDIITARTTFSCYGTGCDREFSLLVKNADGGFANKFLFKSAVVMEKPQIPGLPSSFKASETLCLVFTDEEYGLELRQFYSVFDDTDVIAVSAKLTNNSQKTIRLDRLMSCQLDLDGSGYDIYTYRGAWGRERGRVKNHLDEGVFSSGTISGVSSHSANPLMVVKSTYSGTYAFNLVYSGNHREVVETSPMKLTRVMTGLNDFGGEREIKPTESFHTPEAAMTFGADDSAAERSFHSFVNNHIVPARHKKERPILLNVWGGLSYDFTRDDLRLYAEEAKKLGIEGLVVDDGWFGKRDSADRALGDWFDNEKKTGGLKSLSDELHEKGLMFGVWIEPEMISPDSDLFNAHPDWVMRNPVRQPFLMRNQLWLDLTKPEVREFVFESVGRLIKEYGADYVKWDCNRNVTDAYGQYEGGGVDYDYRYYVGLYSVLERLKKSFPNVLFEGCAAGGGRFDLGMLYYMPQIWASDTTDALARVFIQDGTLAGYPQSAVSAHAGEVLTPWLDRKTRLRDRFAVAASCVLGYELDVRRLTDEEKKEIALQIDFYKKHRTLIVYGENYISSTSFDGFASVRTIVSADKTEAVAFLYKIVNPFNEEQRKYKFAGLDDGFVYRVSCFGSDAEYVVRGDALNSYGADLNDLFIRTRDGEYCSDIHTAVLYIKKIG